MTPPDATEEAAMHESIAEQEADTSGDFRTPHPEDPSDVSAGEDAPPAGAESMPPGESAPAPARETISDRASEERSTGRPSHSQEPGRQPEYRRPENRPWSKPQNFRPAETSAVSQAVAHATEIAESLKHTLDQLDEILELVELAERQKLADEREIDELRRALRRIQPPRHQQHQSRGPRHEDSHRGHREPGPRPEESRQARQGIQEESQRPEESFQEGDPGEPPRHLD